MIKVGVMGYGKAGQAVAEVLRHDPRFELVWVARRTSSDQAETIATINHLPAFLKSKTKIKVIIIIKCYFICKRSD